MPATRDRTNRNGIQVIARAAAILRTLKANPGGMSLGQIAEVVNLPRSTVQRIVGALQAERLVIASSSGGSLRLGPEVSALAEAARFNIVETCRLMLMDLVAETGETADLSVMRGAGMIFLDQVPGTHRLRTVSSVGEVFPLTTTANGKACLSMLEPKAAEALATQEWERRGLRADLAVFMREMEEVRKTGLACDMDEHTAGISALGFAFRDLAGELHAISVPVPSSRFGASRKGVEAALRRTAEQIRKAMVEGS